MKLEPKRTAIISLDVQNDLMHNTQGVIESGMADRMAAVLGAGRNDHGKRQANPHKIGQGIGRSADR